MNVSMGQLVNDAKELVMRLKEREKNVDQVVVQSNALAKKVDAIQQLEYELVNINEKANHRSKVAVLSSIQKENKVIKLLQQENEDLKESLEEHQSVLEIIMSKYRQQMLQLIRLKKQQELSESYYQSAIFKNLQEKTDQIAEMTEIMKHAINIDEETLNETEERLQSLLVENRGLKEMLKIKTKFGGEKMTILVNKEIQTEDINDEPEQKSVIPNNKIKIENKIENFHSEITKIEDTISLNNVEIELNKEVDLKSPNKKDEKENITENFEEIDKNFKDENCESETKVEVANQENENNVSINKEVKVIVNEEVKVIVNEESDNKTEVLQDSEEEIESKIDENEDILLNVKNQEKNESETKENEIITNEIILPNEPLKIQEINYQTNVLINSNVPIDETGNKPNIDINIDAAALVAST